MISIEERKQIIKEICDKYGITTRIELKKEKEE